MKISYKAFSVILGISLISSSAFAAELSVSYGKNNKLSLSGSDFKSPTVSVTVAPSANGTYTSSTPFAFLAEKNCDIDGNFEIATGLSLSVASGYYDAAVYDAALGEIKETFFYCSPQAAGSALSALSGIVTISDLTANSAALGISTDLSHGLDNAKLVTYFNQFKGAGAPSATKFTQAYLGALLCGAKSCTFDEFMEVIDNNTYLLGLEAHSFLSYKADKQKQIFSSLISLNIGSTSFADALTEAAFLLSVNNADTKELFAEAMFSEFKNFLSLDTSAYSALKNPEQVITALMNSTYSSIGGFKLAFTSAVTAQTKAEAEKKESFGGSSSAKGTYSGGTAVQLPSDETVDTTPVAPSVVFDDITTHWAKDAIMHLKDKGIIDGVGNNLFDPERIVSRCEFAKMMAGALYADTSTPKGDFADVADADWFAEYVYALSARGIITGTGDGKFAPHATITRQDAAVIICRAAEFSGIALDELRGEASFDDVDNIADYAKNSVATLYKANLINGVSAQSYAPLSGVTRAQAAQMIYNLLTK